MHPGNNPVEAGLGWEAVQAQPLGHVLPANGKKTHPQSVDVVIFFKRSK